MNSVGVIAALSELKFQPSHVTISTAAMISSYLTYSYTLTKFVLDVTAPAYLPTYMLWRSACLRNML